MAKGHDFNFEGGQILSKIGAAWFVSYSYYNYVDKNHFSWRNPSFSIFSIDSRKGNYNNSKNFHVDWLIEVTKMKQLDKHKNKCGLNSIQIKKMAEEVLSKINKKL